MSTRNSAGLAPVVDLTAARNRPAGERCVARRSDGHLLGNHGNRASALMKQAVIRDLRDIAAIRGDITADDLREAAARADVSYRQVCRWWRADLPQQLDEYGHEHGHGHGHGNGDAGVGDRAKLPRYLYRYAEPGKFQFTRDEIAFIGRHATAKDGFAALAALPDNRVSNVSRSTLYAAWGNVSPAVRAGIKDGDAAQRASEATYPLTGRDQVNESWSIDEYDLKVRAVYRGIVVEPKVLVVRERRSGAPLAYTLLPRSANGTDTGVVLASAAIGFTCAHPRDPDRDLRVAGLPRLLVSDQGGPFLGEPGVAAARRLGISLNPIASHRPQSNGDHEVMHQSLLRHFAAGPGSRRGWTDRTGQRLDHGTLVWEAVVDEVADWWTTLLNTAYTSGDRKGRTRLEVYADEVDAHNAYDGPTLVPADEAAVAVTVAERSYDETRGIVHDNRRWLSPELAAAAKPGERITLKQLLDPDVLYAFDRHDRFIGILLDRDAADLEHVHDLHADRVARQKFVERSIAEPKAAAARADATDAAVAWAEAADGLADAQSDEPADRPADDDGVDDETFDRTHYEVVRPTPRRRQPLVDDDRTAEDTDAEQLAAFYRSNTTRRPISQQDRTQQADQHHLQNLEQHHHQHDQQQHQQQREEKRDKTKNKKDDTDDAR